MPISLQSPVQRAPITKAEVTAFTVDLRSNILQARIAEMTDSGEVVRECQLSEPVSLIDGNGALRVTLAEYQSIKAAIYRLLIADGIVSGEVV